MPNVRRKNSHQTGQRFPRFDSLPDRDQPVETAAAKELGHGVKVRALAGDNGRQLSKWKESIKILHTRQTIGHRDEQTKLRRVHENFVYMKTFLFLWKLCFMKTLSFLGKPHCFYENRVVFMITVVFIKTSLFL
jgi:hypothetical protein